MAKTSAAWPAPAKLNLLLRIVGRRADGYHELQTVFQFLDHQDHLFFSARSDGRIVIRNPLPGVAQEQDLTFRAARLLQVKTHNKQGVTITLDKRLPMGGGLGGGSSDAATTLLALNQIWETRLNMKQLAELGISLGADVPVFIGGQAAWAEGVGDQLLAIDLPEPWYLILTPDCHVSTASVFASPELTRNSPRIKIRDFLEGERNNDCLPVVRKLYPQVAEALDWLDRHAPAQMTGTGACVFAAFPNEAAANDVFSQLPGDLRGFVARGTNRSPLLDKMRSN